MKRDELKELYYIAPIGNLSSIGTHGILCHRRAEEKSPISIAMGEVQERRACTRVPGGRRLHDYANLYFNARNPMLYKRKDIHEEICVLSVSVDVLDLKDVVVTDQNAARAIVGFYSVEEGLGRLVKDELFAAYWTHPGDEHEEYRHKGLMCAEVLVPERVLPSFIKGVYVSTEAAKRAVEATGVSLPVKIRPSLFFF